MSLKPKYPVSFICVCSLYKNVLLVFVGRGAVPVPLEDVPDHPAAAAQRCCPSPASL